MSSLLPRIAYFGLPLGALALIRAGFVPELIVLGRTSALGSRRLLRVARGVPRLELPDWSDACNLQQIAAARPDAILSWFYPKQIPESVLALAPRGAFGTHPSLLPRWRGPDPYFWAIYSGDVETGVSLHRLEREYDTGPVIAQRRLTIAGSDDSWSLAKRLDRPALALLVECARRLAAGDGLEGVEQDGASATPAPQPDDDMLAIDWTQSAARLVQLVRAAAPYPGATTELGEELVEVVRARPYDRPLPRALAPADAVLTSAGVVVCAGDGGVVIEAVRCESGALLRGTEVAALFPEGLARVGF